MKVIVKDSCSRCKRGTEREIEHTEIVDIEGVDLVRAEALKALTETATNNPGLPDLVVIYRGNISSTDKVCVEHCDKSVTNALAIMFKDIDPSKRKPRGPRKPKAEGEVAAPKAKKQKQA